ncbi:hypothetical protein AAG906_031598 [Vitis piasezkii]
MAEIDYQAKATSAPTNGRLKIFGFNVSEDEDVESSKTPSGSPESGGFPATGDRKYECQYCCQRETAAQARSNASHPKRRHFLHPKPHDICVRAAPPSPGSGGSASWVYVPRGPPPFHVSHGCIFPSSSGRGAATLSYAGGVGESTLTTSAPQSRAHGRVDAPSLSSYMALLCSPGSTGLNSKADVYFPSQIM